MAYIASRDHENVAERYSEVIVGENDNHSVTLSAFKNFQREVRFHVCCDNFPIFTSPDWITICTIAENLCTALWLKTQTVYLTSDALKQQVLATTKGE